MTTIQSPNHPTTPSIAFFGTPRIAQIILKKLIATEFKPQLVITGHDKKSGRGQAFVPTSVKLEAQKSNIEVGYRMSDLDKGFDIAMLVAYGHIIPKAVLELPKFGFLNVHPSLLPKYRGPSPIQSAILEGETQTGVTIMKLDKELDHGPILAQRKIPIDKKDTHETLMQKLAIVGADLLLEVLPHYLDGSQKPKQQNHSKATLTQKITKEDGCIDLENPPSPQKLDRMIRAFYPWPGVYTKLKMKNEKLKIIKFLPNLPTILQSYNPTDPFLLQPEGKKPMTIKEFLNGYQHLESQIRKLLGNQNL